MQFNTSYLQKVFTREYGVALLREEDLENLNKEIYRYIDLRSFCQIVSQKKMYVSRKKAFTDYYENGGHISFCYWVNFFRPVDNHFPEKYESMWKEREKNIPVVQNVPISCWSLSGGDDYYRWSANMKYPITICIGTTVRSLIDSFDEATSILAGKVKYCDKPSGNPDDMALFSKKKAYQCEKEFRFCFPAKVGEDDAGDGVFIKLKSVDWINSIHIGTLIDRDLALSLFHFLQTIPSIKDKVHLSVINEKEKREKTS